MATPTNTPTASPLASVGEIHVLLDLEFGLADIGPNDHLIEDGLLDSLSIIELVPLLEDTFGVAIPDMALTLENLATVHAIAALVETCR